MGDLIRDKMIGGHIKVEILPPEIAEALKAPKSERVVYAIPIYSADVGKRIIEILLKNRDLAEKVYELYKKYQRLCMTNFESDERLEIESKLKSIFLKQLENADVSGTITIRKLDEDSWIVKIQLIDENASGSVYVEGTGNPIRAGILAFRKFLEERDIRRDNYYTLFELLQELSKEIRRQELEKIKIKQEEKKQVLHA